MKVVYRVESDNGDDTYQLPADQTQPQVEKILAEDKLVTVEYKDGSTELLGKKDAPDWQNMFGKATPNVKPPTPPASATGKPTPSAAKIIAKSEQTPILSAEELKQNEWAKKFKEVKTVTATKKQQGG